MTIIQQLNLFNTTGRFTGLIMVIIRKGPELLGVERVNDDYSYEVSQTSKKISSKLLQSNKNWGHG